METDVSLILLPVLGTLFLLWGLSTCLNVSWFFSVWTFCLTVFSWRPALFWRGNRGSRSGEKGGRGGWEEYRGETVVRMYCIRIYFPLRSAPADPPSISKLHASVSHALAPVSNVQVPPGPSSQYFYTQGLIISDITSSGTLLASNSNKYPDPYYSITLLYF